MVYPEKNMPTQPDSESGREHPHSSLPVPILYHLWCDGQNRDMTSDSSAKGNAAVRRNPDQTIPHRWKPGQSGNPKGYYSAGNQSAVILSKAYRAQLAMPYPGDPRAGHGQR